MNAARRKQIEEIVEQLLVLQSEIESLQEQEQEEYDNMPEGLQMSERGQKAEEATNALGDSVCTLDQAISELEPALCLLGLP